MSSDCGGKGAGVIQYDVSCVVTFHAEGYMGYRTLTSINACRTYAEQRNLKVELVVVLDCADEDTKKVVEKHPALRPGDQVLTVENHDLGLSRNDGVKAARGQYISIHDGDDYYSENCVYEGVMQCDKEPSSIAHVGTLIEFETNYCVTRICDIRNDDYTKYDFIKQHPLISESMANRNVYLEHPYLPAGNGFGYEDWHWNAETIAEGFVHIPIPNTFLFYRRKKQGSMLAQFNSQKSIIRPSKLFDQLEVKPLKIELEEKKQTPLNDDSGTLLGTKRKFSATVKSSVKKKILKFPQELQKPALAAAKALWILGRSAQNYLKRKTHPLQERGPSYSSVSTRFSGYDDCLEALRKMSSLDSTLHPDVNPPLYEYKYTQSGFLGMLFANLYNPFRGKKYDVVYLVPWLVRGGADLMAINFANLLTEEGKKILVIATLQAESPWRAKLLSSVDFMDLGNSLRYVVPEERELLLARILLQLQPKAVHCMNSKLGLDLFLNYGRALKEYMKLYVALYCDDRLSDGTDYGYVSRYLTALAPLVTKFSTDNAIMPQVWQEKYGVPASFFHTVYGFVPEEKKDIRPLAERSKGILWAGRFDAQKRPDLLLEIAAAMPDFQFYVYGAPSLNDTFRIYERLKKFDNVHLGGSYDGFSALPVEQCGCFLYTSAYDGLPNALLEAASAGLPIVAPDVGAIRDFINDSTGWLLPGKASANQYAATIKTLFTDLQLCQSKINNASVLLKKRHCRDNLKKKLRQFYGF